MKASDRLGSILHSGHFYGYRTFSGGLPAVCFSEVTENGLRFLITRRDYEPWALVVDRQSVYDLGGGPVWYARPEQYDRLGQLDPVLRSWAVRLDPGSDWLEEHEWRIVLEGQPVVPLTSLRVVAIVVGEPAWTGSYQQFHPDATGQLQPYSIPMPLPAGLPRWWWNPATSQLELLDPPS